MTTKAALHTPAKWYVNSLPPARWRYISDKTGATVASVAEWRADDGTLIQEFKGPAAQANAKRIVACVNACEGITTEELELGEPEWLHKKYMDVIKENNALRAERDALHEILIEAQERLNVVHEYIETKTAALIRADRS